MTWHLKFSHILDLAPAITFLYWIVCPCNLITNVFISFGFVCSKIRQGGLSKTNGVDKYKLTHQKLIYNQQILKRKKNVLIDRKGCQIVSDLGQSVKSLSCLKFHLAILLLIVLLNYLINIEHDLVIFTQALLCILNGKRYLKTIGLQVTLDLVSVLKNWWVCALLAEIYGI